MWDLDATPPQVELWNLNATPPQVEMWDLKATTPQVEMWDLGTKSSQAGAWDLSAAFPVSSEVISFDLGSFIGLCRHLSSSFALIAPLFKGRNW